MTGADTTVTAVVVSCNQVRWLGDALASVSAQTRPPDQVVVVDDGSTDGSHEVIRAWARTHRPDAVLELRTENLGVVRTLNRAFGLVTSDMVAPLAADDLWLPDKLAVQVPQLAALPPGVGVLYGDVPCVDEDSRPIASSFIETYKGRRIAPRGELFTELLQGNFLPSPSLLLRRECWERVGGFDESLYMEDWDFWLRVSQHFTFEVTPAPVGRYRVIGHSHVRRGGAVALEGQLATLRKWERHPAMRTAEARRGLRALAAWTAKQHELDGPRRRRTARAWLRLGGYRLLLRGRGMGADTGGGYVLWVAAELAADPRSGGDLRTHRLLSALAARTPVRVVVVGPCDDPERIRAATGAEDVKVLSRGGSRPRTAARALLRRWPVATATAWSPRARRLVRNAATDGALVVVGGPQVIPYLPRGRHVLALENAEAALAADSPPAVGRAARLRQAWDAPTTRRLERRAVRRAGTVTVVSQHDARLLGVPALVVPNGADVPAVTTPVPADGSLLLVGALRYAPNRDAVTFWADEVWQPGLPPLTVVGTGSEWLDPRLAAHAGVDLVGEVAEVASWLQEAALVVVPLRYGGGTRLKVLEALAHGRPVLSTTKGCEGLPVTDGHDVVLADSPAALRAALGRLLADREERQRLADRGRELAQAQDWRVVTAPLVEAVQAWRRR